MKNPEEIVIKHDLTPKPGWPCPSCHGQGHRNDGSLSISQTETRFKPSTKCHVCEGSGRVNVTPIKP